MRTRLVPLVIGLLFVGISAGRLAAQDVRLRLDLAGASVRLVHDTLANKIYQVQVSADLRNWSDTGGPVAGNGQPASHDMGAAGSTPRFFRLAITDASADLAPTVPQMTQTLVGTTRFTYAFTSPTRFAWNTETGDWNYAKTGPDTGLLVFTYDSDNNNPDVYREEIVLSFTIPLAGTYQYFEYTHGVKTYSSSGSFSLQ